MLKRYLNSMGQEQIRRLTVTDRHHLITGNYLTTGVHHYYRMNAVPPNGIAKGTITFISPEVYPHSLWIGKKISIQEGARVVGHATITKIFNPLLCLKDKD